eukprot:scaffold11375_cov123-Isochrysis_galbana.AAC.8
MYGGAPVISSIAVIPSAQMSTPASYPEACSSISGADQNTCPAPTYVCRARRRSPNSRSAPASERSESRTFAWASTSTAAALSCRWIKPMECSTAAAAVSSRPHGAARRRMSAQDPAS